VALESIDEFQLADSGGEEDPLAVTAEPQPCPLTAGVVLPHVKRRKRTLREYDTWE